MQTCVYIASNGRKTMRLGLSRNLASTRLIDGAQFNRIVFAEWFGSFREAETRLLELTALSPEQLQALVMRSNPAWKDLLPEMDKVVAGETAAANPRWERIREHIRSIVAAFARKGLVLDAATLAQLIEERALGDDLDEQGGVGAVLAAPPKSPTGVRTGSSANAFPPNDASAFRGYPADP